MENAEALVLHRVEFSESSLILSLYTKEFGKIQALAKGGRRLKGPFESALDILARIRVLFIQKRSDALDLLTESKLVKRFHVNESNIAGLFGGYYVVELIHCLTEENDPNPGIFDLAIDTLSQLEEGSFVMRSLVRFETLFLREIGQQPSLRYCVECGEEIDAGPLKRKRIAFGHWDGGVLCPRCVTGHQQVASVSVEALRALEKLSLPNDEEAYWKRIPLAKTVLGEIRGLMNHYLSHQIGRKLRSSDWLKFISREDKEF